MQLENLRPQRNIDNNDKQSDKRYYINMIDDKESDEIYQIGENKEETLNIDIEVLKLRKLISQKIYRLSWEIIWWKKSDGYELWQGIWWKISDK